MPVKTEGSCRCRHHGADREISPKTNGKGAG